MTRTIAVLLLAGCGNRIEVYQPGEPGFTAYEQPETAGECTTDLQCTTNGCGNHCTSIDTEPFIGTCEYAAHNDFAACGCVEQRCRWFSTDPVRPALVD
jgi:hypothetical protein